MTCTTPQSLAQWRELVGRALSEGLAPEEQRGLFSHLGACAACRADYDASSAGVAALERRPAQPPEAVRDRIARDLFAALEAEGAIPRAEAKLLGFPRPARPRSVWLAAAGGLALAAGLTMALLPQDESTRGEAPQPEFAPRGGAGAGLGFSVYCIRVAGGAPEVVSTATAGSGHPGECRLGDRIQFTYSATTLAQDAGPETLSLFGLGPEGQVVWYWPRADAVVPVEPGARQRAIAGSFELAARHAPGTWRIFGLFGPRALDTAGIEAQVRSGGPAALRPLAQDGRSAVLQAMLEIAPDMPGGPRP